MTDERHVHNQLFDGFRAIAILLVVFFHVNFGLSRLLPDDALQQHMNDMPALFNISWHALGSEVIFFISGYLLTLILLLENNKQGRISPRNFYIKRVARILPLYYAALLLYSFAGEYTLYEWVLNLLFLSKVAGESTIIPVGWSLELQMQYFLMVPFLVIALNRSRHPVVLLLVATVFSIWLRYDLISSDPDFLNIRLHQVFKGVDASQAQLDSYYLIQYRMSALLLGMLLAYFYVDYRERLRALFVSTRSGLPLSILGMLLFVFFGFAPTHNAESFVYREFSDQAYLLYMTFERPLFIVGVSLLMLQLLFAPGVFRPVIPLMGNRVFRVISNSIYPLYLFHFPFVLLAFIIVYRTTDRTRVTSTDLGQLLLLMLLSAALATIVSWLIHRYAELPLQTAIRNRFLRRH